MWIDDSQEAMHIILDTKTVREADTGLCHGNDVCRYLIDAIDSGLSAQGAGPMFAEPGAVRLLEDHDLRCHAQTLRSGCPLSIGRC